MTVSGKNVGQFRSKFFDQVDQTATTAPGEMASRVSRGI